MKRVNLILAMAISTLCISSAFAGTSEVTWSNSDKYRDIDPGQGHRAKFKKNVFSHLEKHFNKLAADLPEGQVLKIDVFDVDLAGDVNIGGIHRIRIVKDLYFPRIKFRYQVIDASGDQVIHGQENLKDMNFLSQSSLKYSNDFLGYEKKMLDNWFKDTFN